MPPQSKSPWYLGQRPHSADIFSGAGRTSFASAKQVEIWLSLRKPASNSEDLPGDVQVFSLYLSFFNFGWQGSIESRALLKAGLC